MFPEIPSLDATSLIILAIAALLSLWFVISRLKTKLHLPPSPCWGLPLNGHLYFVKRNPKKQFREWGKRFGGMFTLKMGSKRVVVITSFELLKETLVRRADVFSDRSDKFITDICPFMKDGIIMSSGEQWEEETKVAVNIFRSLSTGHNHLQDRVTFEADYLWGQLASYKGEAMDVRPIILFAVCNVISATVFNKRFNYQDKHLLKLLDAMEELQKLGYRVGLLNYFPCFRYLPFDAFNTKRYKQVVDEISAYVEELVGEVKSTFNPKVLDCFTAHYLCKMNETELITARPFLSENNLVATIINFFLAGTDSTANTLEWAVLYAVKYPSVQEIIHTEILQRIGRKRAPTLQDGECLHYLRAFICEVQRMSSVAPFAVTHACKEEVEVRGYTFPAGIQIIPDLDAVLKSEELWGDPLVFRPERFLDYDGKIVRREYFIPFSIGHRQCLGKEMAEAMLFLFLCIMFQHFQIVPEDQSAPPPVREAPGSVSLAESFRVRYVEREEESSGF